jgi:phage gpG-like protein
MINVTLTGADAIGRALDALDSSKARKKIMRKVGRLVINKTKKRTTRQTTPDGEKFKPHAQQRKRKMLVRLARRLAIIELGDKSATVGFKNNFEAMIGGRQQYGHTQQVNKSRLRRTSETKKQDPATRAQAKALIAEGYKIKRKNGRGTKTPTIRDIVTTMTIGRAGSILRALRGTKTSWTTTIPARPFLGVSDDDLNEIATLALAQIEAELRAA